jgi:nucleoside-diphosphate-sugar epimerase
MVFGVPTPSRAADLAGRRILVTGAGGFIGSHLCSQLLAVGAEVRALCRYTSHASRGMLEELDPQRQAEVVLGDVREPETLDRAARGTDAVFHLAAHIGIPWSYESPRDVIETNVLGTLNVCQAVRAHGVGRLVHVSTSEVYGEPVQLPIAEEHPIAPRSPYAASKASADHVVASFVASFGLPAVTIRPFNTIGPGQSSRAVLPAIVGQALRGGAVRLGALEPRRDLTYVADTAAGLIAAATADVEGEVIQLGTGHAVSVAELVDLVGAALGRTLEVVPDDQRVRPAASEISELRSDPRKARERLGWVAATALADGVAATVDWAGRRGLDATTEYVR